MLLKLALFPLPCKLFFDFCDLVKSTRRRRLGASVAQWAGYRRDNSQLLLTCVIKIQRGIFDWNFFGRWCQAVFERLLAHCLIVIVVYQLLLVCCIFTGLCFKIFITSCLQCSSFSIIGDNLPFLVLSGSYHPRHHVFSHTIVLSKPLLSLGHLAPLHNRTRLALSRLFITRAYATRIAHISLSNLYKYI